MNDWFIDFEKYYHDTGIPTTYDEYAFDVYEHYFRNFVSFFREKYSNTDGYLGFLLERTASIERNNSLNIELIRKFLYIAWNTEYLVRLNDNSPELEFIKVNNQWKPIQVYYSIYSLIQAACYALKGRAFDNHSKCLNTITDYLINTPLEPWNYHIKGYCGNERVSRTILPYGFPFDIDVPRAMKRRDVSPMEVIACCIQAEHRNRIDEYKKPARRDAPYKYLYEPTPTSLFHFLYRLRKKSNYENVEVFITSAPDEKIRAFSSNLTLMNVYANILLETLIIRRIGNAAFIRIMRDFSRLHPNESIISTRANMYEERLVD